MALAGEAGDKGGSLLQPARGDTPNMATTLEGDTYQVRQSLEAKQLLVLFACVTIIHTVEKWKPKGVPGQQGTLKSVSFILHWCL